MNKYTLLYVIISMLLIHTSCQHDDYDNKGGDTGKIREFSFVVTLPKFALPEKVSLRSMGQKENEISRIDVLLFKIDASGNETLIYKNEATNISQTSNSIKFKSILLEDLNVNIVLIANISNSIITTLNGFTIGTPKTTILEALEVSNTGKWDSDENSVYTPIPMYGETGSINITSSTGTIDEIILRRMLAKIDISVQTSAFTLKNVYLCNYNTLGYISPAWNATTGAISMNTSSIPNTPDNPNPQTGKDHALKYSVSGASNSLNSEIYTFEAQESTDNNESIRKASPCLVVEGEYDNKNYFYRVDFTYDSGANKSNYMPLLRNHIYDVRIIRAEGIGYNTLEEALNSYTVVSNLKTRIINYDMVEMKDLNYNGQYILALSDDGLLAREYESTYEFSFDTDYPEGAEIIGISNNENTANFSCSWLTVSELNTYKNYHQMTLKVEALPATGEDARVGYINIKAGRLQASFEVIQCRNNIRNSSNCYMVKPGTSSIFIPVSRAEEGIPGSLSRRNNFKEKFIWTDNSNGLSTSGAVSEIKVYGKGRKALLSVKPGIKEGNAVIAVKDQNQGLIKWSWHIWVTNYIPSTTDQFMDRNLGALSNFLDNQWWLSRGLFYQWGRKDPFPNTYEKETKPKPDEPSIDIIFSKVYTYDEHGQKIKDIPFSSFDDALTSVQNPLLFSDGVSKEWWGSGNPKWTSWGEDGDKSVFDPSPEGWRVVKDLNSFVKSQFTSNVYAWNNTSISTVYGSPTYYGGYFTSTTNAGLFYPGAGGLFYGKNSHDIVNNDVAVIGYYWTAKSNKGESDSSEAKSYVFKITETTVKDTPEKSLRNRGFSIRCVRE